MRRQETFFSISAAELDCHISVTSISCRPSRSQTISPLRGWQHMLLLARQFAICSV